MSEDLRQLLSIPYDCLDDINALLLNPDTQVVNDFLAVVEKYGTPQEINEKAARARQLPALLQQVRATKPEYLADLEWLQQQRDAGAFISVADYRRKVLGAKADQMQFADDFAVTLEISAAQYFPWVIEIAKRAIAEGKLMPGRFIKVRKMKEQEKDGDLAATIAAMQIIGASLVETLDTKGTDGSNIHLGGPATITGYFGGIGQPNRHPLKWADEYLKYYTTYGVRQVLNINPGTVLVGYLMHRLGIDNEFKISVFMGNDNPFAILWTLLGARLFAREDGGTSLIGFNLSNSADNETLRQAAYLRKALGLEAVVRFEHHITETWKSIVRQPYNRRTELVEIAGEVPNISAKHEGGEPDIEPTLEHPSDILDYFLAKADAEKAGLMPALEKNYLEKHRSVQLTAQALVKAGIGVVCAPRLHT